MNIWDQVLQRIRARIPEEDFHRWFGATAYASDSGDQITVWVPTESIRRHIASHWDNAIDRALAELGRNDTHVRLVVSGVDEDEDE
jgi:chromosomal replication initiation ATPase DnaA